MPWVADYTRRIAPSALKAAGVVGVCRYLSYPVPSGKVIGRGEYDELRGAGLAVTLNWEYTARDWLGATSAGHAHGLEAARQAKALGHPAGSVIPGSADFDMSRAQWDSAGRAYATAYRDALNLSGYSAGVYSGWDVLSWCRDLGGYHMFWQSKSTGFSGGRNGSPWPGGHLLQHLATRTVGGVEVDYNEIRQANWQGSENDVSAETDKDMTYLAPRAEALAHMLPTIRYGPEKGAPVQLVQAVQAINAGLADVKAAVGKVSTGGAPTQEQVNTAVAAVLNDASWLAAFGSELAKHIKVS
jgi:hypothetical protein